VAGSLGSVPVVCVGAALVGLVVVPSCLWAAVVVLCSGSPLLADSVPSVASAPSSWPPATGAGAAVVGSEAAAAVVGSSLSSGEASGTVPSAA